MVPVVFGDCMGFLHPADDHAACGRAVILCESFGYEALCTQRAMLSLARMLANAGLPTLRFHYPGTGDSAGDEAPGQIERWIDSIGAAAQFLRDTCGAQEIALCGFRLGGLLAVEAAKRWGGIAALALLAPVVSGRAYARELILSGAMIANREGSVPPDWREILGYRLHASDLETLRRLDLSKTHGAGAAPRILLVSPDAAPPGLAPSIRFQHFQHYDGLTQHAQDIVMPMRVFTDTVHWLRQDAPAATAGRRLQVAPAQLEAWPGVSETPLWFGDGNRCFGILARPAARRHDCAVLILNSGLNAHTGNGRGGVRLARRLAAEGVATLRIDMGKIGESAPESPMDPVGFHDLGRIRDISAALDVLEDAGYPCALLTGICAGAYIALHAAAADNRVRSAVLVNLPYFYIRNEDPAVPLWRRPLALGWWLLNGTRQWCAALTRDRRPMLGAGHFRRTYLIGRGILLLHYSALAAKQRLLELMGRVLPASWAMGYPDRLLKRLSQMGVCLTLVYSSNDWGLVELGIVFSDNGKRLIENGWGAIRFIEGADHTITTSWMQDVYATIVETQLGLRPAPATAPSGAVASEDGSGAAAPPVT